MAAKRFSGRWTESNFAAKEEKLRAALADEDIRTLGDMERAAYNGPFTLPFLRRNEVMLAVDRLPAAARLLEDEAAGQFAAQ